MKEEIKKYLVENAVVVINHISSKYRGMDEEVAVVKNIDTLGLNFQYDNGCFSSINNFDDRLERKHCAEINKWLVFHTWRIAKVYAPVEGMTKEEVLATQKPVWVNQDTTPMELETF